MLRTLFVLTILAAASAAAPAAAQDTGEPAGGWAHWLGLHPGDSIPYSTPDGGRTCAMVGEPIGPAGSRWLPLDNLPWPGFASDSRVLLPLDGPARLATIRSPGPRPRLDTLIPAGDGWVAEGDSADPDRLIYIWCSTCMDAGTRLVLERGAGIVALSVTTIAGTERFERVEGGCAERPAE